MSTLKYKGRTRFDPLIHEFARGAKIPSRISAYSPADIFATLHFRFYFLGTNVRVDYTKGLGVRFLNGAEFGAANNGAHYLG